MLIKILIVLGFGIAVAVFVMSSTNKKTGKKSKIKSRKRGGTDIADIGDLADALTRATEAMEKLQAEQSIDRLSSKYSGNSSATRTQSAPRVKLDRIY
jgi:hypothetical protein